MHVRGQAEKLQGKPWAVTQMICATAPDGKRRYEVFALHLGCPGQLRKLKRKARASLEMISMLDSAGRQIGCRPITAPRPRSVQWRETALTPAREAGRRDAEADRLTTPPRGGVAMLSSYRVACPYEGCGWSGGLAPSLLQGGAEAEAPVVQRAWFRCPGCRRDWEVRAGGDGVAVLPAAERGRGPARRKASVPMASAAEPQACPNCGRANSAAGAKTLRVEMRPVLTEEVFAFPDALAEVSCLRCEGCGHWACLDYRIELDDNPELDINPGAGLDPE
jgi:hypothetical protein